MQAIQPAAKKLQEKYKDRDPARLNQELQKLYADNQARRAAAAKRPRLRSALPAACLRAKRRQPLRDRVQLLTSGGAPAPCVRAQVNPLAGCLPAFAQIPIFIGFYRALLALAKEDLLTEPFLWIPSLEGPSRDYTEGIKWLTDGWSNGAPPLGWSDTAAYLVLPVVLTASQFLSTQLLTPKNDDPAQQQSQAILKFLPLMIG
eukprot:3819138-Prymnesium_polylepis.1